MWELKACAVCLSTGIRLYSLNTGNLRHEFNSISGLKTTKRSGMPNHLCVECCAYVKKFIKFQQKCQRAHYTLEQMLGSNMEIKKTHLKSLNRKQLGIMPSLSLIDLDRTHYETHKFQWITTNSNRRAIASQFDYIPVVHYGTLTKEDTFEDVMTNTIEVEKENIIKIEDRNEHEDENDNIKAVVVAPVSARIMEPVSTVQGPDINMIDETKSDIEPVDDIESNYMEINNVNGMDYDCDNNDLFGMSCKFEDKDGAKFNEEYAQMVPITVKDAKAAFEVKKLFLSGLFKCAACGRGFKTKDKLKEHSSMHDKHMKGTYHCEICNYYYKTQFLLDCHMTEKHMYKYLCKMCPEVSFDRLTAKAHYCVRHLKTGPRWPPGKRPAWLGRGVKKPYANKRSKPITINDVFSFEPISPEEQYSMIQDRKSSRNYLEAKYKCEFCYRGYRLMTTYSNHMVKHNPSISGNLQCDMCKLYFRDQRKMYKHMNMYHLNKFSCMTCDSVFTNRSQAVAHYRWHKNVTYDCAHCDKKFVCRIRMCFSHSFTMEWSYCVNRKASTQLTHIRLKHPSTDICNLCGHSFVSSAGLVCHKQITHGNEEAAALDDQPVDTTHPNYCAECGILFASEHAFSTHLGSSSKHTKTNISVQKTQRDSRKRMRREMGAPSRPPTREVGLVGAKRSRNGTSEVLNTGVTTSNNCEVCNKYLVNDVQARRHYEAEHPGSDFLRRYMCEICGHTARQYANLIVHMRTHTNEKPYGCPHCDRRFSMLSNRDRHLVVHTGEKRFQCQHCSRRFTQSSAVKLHIQTVHLKIPYAPWDKKNRKRRKELEAAGVSSDVNLAEAPAMPPCAPQPKLLLDAQGEYINAYITYSDE